MSEPTCLYEVQDHIATITMNRPHRMNAMNAESYGATAHAFRQAESDPAVRCIIFTGAGRGFCSGDDVQELMADGGGLAEAIDSGVGEGTPGPVMERTDLPIIAAVNGPAIGYGFELALLADIRIASTKARFSQMFIKRGLIAPEGSFRILNQLCGPAAAAEIFLTGDMVSAEDALALGVVSKVVEHDDLMAAARELAARITANPPLAVRDTKKALRLARIHDRNALIEHTGDALRSLVRTEDHHESVAAFLQKRDPVFHGR